MATTVAEKIIRIDVVTSAGAQRSINALASDLKKVEGSTAQMQRTLNSGFGSLSATFTKIGGFLGGLGLTTGFTAITRAVLESASAYEVLESRLALVLGTTQQATRATQEIFEIAKITGREVDGVGKLYEKAARSAAQFGIDQSALSQITLGFSQAIRLSGASTQEAYAGLVQFGQALASGRLQGDEFRSLMENNSVFMYEFARSAGVTVTVLRKMGTEGKLNAKFMFDTMLKSGSDGLNMLERLNAMAKNVPLTFSQSLNSLKSGLLLFVGESYKALELKGEDKLGIFGDWIRAIDALAQKVRELNVVADAKGTGFFAKAAEYALLGTTFFNSFAFGGPIFGGKIAEFVLGKRETLSNRLAKENQDIATQLDKAEENLNRLAKITGDKARKGVGPAEIDRLALGDAAREVERLRALQARVTVAEAQDTALGYSVPKSDAAGEKEPDKKLESAREALARFIVNLRERAELQRAMFADENLNVETYKGRLDLEEALRKAQVGNNSAQAQTAEVYLRQEETFRRLIESRDEYKKTIADEIALLQTRGEKVQENMQRDIAAMDALRGGTKASQEFSTDRLEKELKDLRDVRAAWGYSTDKREDPLIGQAETLVGLYEKALETRGQLTEMQARDKQQRAQDIVDRENFKRVDSLANEINEDLKRGIAEGKVGASLFDNIQKTFKEKAIDVVINPITSLLSRAMAAFADDFGKLLSKQIYSAFANQTSDPIGSFIQLMGLGNPFGASGSAAGIGVDYSLPFTNVRFGAKEGLSYVPFDNFPASLHRGERVLTAQENSKYGGRGGITISHNPIIQIDARTDRAQVYQIAFEASQQSNAALVAELNAQGVL